MDNITEKEQPTIEVVRLGQAFPLFTKEMILPELTDQDKEFGPIVILDEPQIIPNLPIFIRMRPLSELGSIPDITPFNLGDVYTITEDDLDPIKRFEKVKKTRLPKFDRESYFMLSIISSGKLKKSNPELFDMKGVFKQEILETFRKLRLLVFFPQGERYEAQPRTEGLEKNGKLDFHSFYPLDTGPLPTPPEGSIRIGDPNLRKGYDLRLPRDMSELSRIVAKVVIVEEQSEENLSTNLNRFKHQR